LNSRYLHLLYFEFCILQTSPSRKKKKRKKEKEKRKTLGQLNSHSKFKLREITL
jgi:hypothetical protein